MQAPVICSGLQPGSESRTHHIALLVRTLTGSGTARGMLQLAAGMAERGHRVDLLVCHPAGQLSDEVPDAVNWIGLHPQHRLPSLLRIAKNPEIRWPFPFFSDAPYLEPVAEYLRSRRPDVLLSAATFANTLALLGRRMSGTATRVVVSQHMNLTAQVRPPTKRWKLPMARALYPQADGIVAVSREVGRDLSSMLELPPGRVRTIYNPAVTPTLLEMSKAPLDHPWFERGGPPVVVAAGKLKPRKDFAMLVRAVRLLRDSLDVRLVILGEGPERVALNRLAKELGIADSVDLPGFEPNPYAFMARAAVFALPSRWEGFGNVLIEALACGCPTVSTDCRSGPSEILEDGAYGALVPVGDERAMAAAIADTIDKPPPQDLLRKRASEFTRDRAVDEYLRVMLD